MVGLALSMCLAAGSVSEAAVFTCGGGDVPCLIAAINAANANDQVNTIRLGEGVYTLMAVDNSTDGPNGLPSVTSTLTITGAGATVTTVERAASSLQALQFRIFHVGPQGVLTLRRLTIRGGSQPDLLPGGDGSGVLAAGAVRIADSVITRNGFRNAFSSGAGVVGTNVTVTRSTISDNKGPGIYIPPGGSLTVRRSTIEHNGGVGGIRFTSSGRLIVADTTITRNDGYYAGGGGLGIDGGATATITNSTISANAAQFTGGGIHVGSNSTVTIAHSAVVDNQAGYDHDGEGGGIQVSGGTVAIRDSTIARNRATSGFGLAVCSAGNSGSLYCSGDETASVTVTNSTITENAQSRHLGESAGIRGNIRLENTVLARNQTCASFQPLGCTYAELNCYGPITSLGHNLISDPARCGDLQPTDLVGDPRLGDFMDPGRPGTGHYPLLAGSLAIDAADDEACSRRDQQGLVRGIDGNADSVRGCDIGAIEFYPVVTEWVQLDRVRATFVPPDPTQPNPLAAGGSYQIDAAFTNVGGETICRVAFDVITLDVASGVASVLRRNGDLIGREGIEFPATQVGERANLRAGDQERYRFTIGVTEPAPITLFVNVMGERTAGSCALRPVSADDAGFVDPDRE